MLGDAAQYRDLVALYGSYGDEELVSFARSLGDLTEMAQEALKGELTRRHLAIPSSKGSTSPNSAGDSDPIDRFAELAPEDCIWEFAEAEDALVAYEALRASGIESSVILPRMETMDTGPPRLVVALEGRRKNRGDSFAADSRGVSDSGKNARGVRRASLQPMRYRRSTSGVD